MFNNIYKGKRVFLTGHTGFKGAWLSVWLTKLGAYVCGYSLCPKTQPSIFSSLNIEEYITKSIIGDILDEEKLTKEMLDFSPDIIFHLAAQPLVRESYKEPVLTYKTNVIGSLNVMESARKTPSVKAFVNITTDKCYENIEQNYSYKEDDKLGGYDMYSSSKACSEILTSSYRRSFLDESYAIASARAGNVIGGGDWANDRLIPDCVRAINNKEHITLRNPNAVRPWQFVLEPLSGYLLLGQKLLENGTGSSYCSAFNFGPENNSALSVKEIVEKFITLYAETYPVNIENSNLHEANLLMLNIEKAKNILDWKPVYNIETALEETANWYKSFYAKNQNMLDYTINQINKYEECFSGRYFKTKN